MRTSIAFFASLLLLATAPTAQVGTSGAEREAFTAVALGTGGPRTGAVATAVEIVIERWSTAAERQRVFDTLTRGQQALLDTLQDLPPVGSIRTPGNLAWDLRYAHQVPLDEGGRRIVLATDRPITTWEAINQPRTIDYPFTFIELRVNREGVGEGKLSRATRVTAGDGGRFVQLENYATQAVDLTEVRPRK